MCMVRKFAKIILILFLALATLGFAEPKAEVVKLIKSPELESFGISVEQKGDYVLLCTDNLFMKVSLQDDTLYIYDRVYELKEDLRQEKNRLIIPRKSMDFIKDLILYNDAVIDTKIAEKKEILPLVHIDKTKEKVLVGTWHKYPTSYPTGKDTVIRSGEVWVFTKEEIFDFARKNKLDENIALRLEKLIGLPPNKGYTHFSLLWVSPKDLLRPAFNSDIEGEIIELELIADKDFAVWFNNNTEYSYKNNRYPWTRLGYTYDWENNGKAYGLTEFIIKKGSPITVERTYTSKEFFKLLCAMSEQ